jgi:hypothetical protein
MRAPPLREQVTTLQAQVDGLTTERDDLLKLSKERDEFIRAQHHTITHLTEECAALRADLDTAKVTLSGMDTSAVDQESPQEEEAEPVTAAPEADDAMRLWQQHNNCAVGRHTMNPLDFMANTRHPYCVHCGVKFRASSRQYFRMVKGAAVFVVLAIAGWLIVAQLVPVVHAWLAASALMAPPMPTTAGATSLPTLIEDEPPLPALPPNSPSILSQW